MATSFRTAYFDSAVFDLHQVIENAVAQLDGVDFDTLVGTGFSGGIVVPALALSMGKKFVLIRKEGDDSHHGGGRLVGELGARWIFVDDFVDSGRTRARVIRKINDASKRTTLVGQYMYEYPVGFQSVQDGWTPEEGE